VLEKPGLADGQDLAGLRYGKAALVERDLIVGDKRRGVELVLLLLLCHCEPSRLVMIRRANS
jgi:hypothetical protein